MIQFIYFMLLFVPISFAQKSVVPVKPPGFVEEMNRFFAKNPDATLQYAAQHANQLLAMNGIDYYFDWQGNRKSKTLSLHSADATFTARFHDTESKLPDALCGENYVALPVSYVSDKEIFLVHEGKSHKVNRPKNLFLPSVQILSKDLKKTILQVDAPRSVMPLGISKDGAAIYFPIHLSNAEATLKWWKKNTPLSTTLPHSLPYLVLEITKKKLQFKGESHLYQEAASEDIQGAIPVRQGIYKLFTEAGLVVVFAEPCT
jgi:hypothetical protein